MKKKISKIKYSLGNISWLCPECHKDTMELDKHFIPRSLDGPWSCNGYTNICPHCGYSFDNTDMIMFPHAEIDFPDAPDPLTRLINYSCELSINCNDQFGPACCWDETLDENLIALYLTLVSKEKMNSQNTLDALCQWHAGRLFYNEKLPSKELKQIRKLTGWEWYPDIEEKDNETFD